MSTIRYHSDVPHIVRYGHLKTKTDDNENSSWMLFWRNANCFEVSVNETDITGTRFEQQWLQSLIANHEAVKSMKHSAWVKCWDDLCDSVFIPIQSTLESLAPTGQRSWGTLEDYISTPGYRLSIHKAPSESDEDITVRVDEGPTIMSAYSFHPLPLSAFPGPLPVTLPQIPASDLLILDQTKNLKAQPDKVQLPDKTIAYLVGAEPEITKFPEEIVTHPFMDTITTYFKLHELFADPSIPNDDLSCLLDPLAIITTTTPMPTSSPNFEVSDMYVAGFLLPYLTHSPSLGDPSSISLLVSMPNIDTIRRRLHHNVLRTVTIMHSRTPPIIHGNINPWTILVRQPPTTSSAPGDNGGLSGGKHDQDVQMFLVGFSPGLAHNLFIDPELTGTMQADLEGLENVLGDEGWLVHEIKKARGDLATDEKWHRRAVPPLQSRA